MFQVILNKNSETYTLLAVEAVEFMMECLHNGMSLHDIRTMYITRKSIPLGYGTVLQQLIREHVECHTRLVDAKNI